MSDENEKVTHIADYGSPAEKPMITLRMPLSHWRGIVNGIEEWAGDSASKHEILQDIELLDGDPSAIWWINGHYEQPPPAPKAITQHREPPTPFSLAVVECPACNHGIDPHGLDPGDICGVGSADGTVCGCLWSPNDIAGTLLGWRA